MSTTLNDFWLSFIDTIKNRIQRKGKQVKIKKAKFSDLLNQTLSKVDKCVNVSYIAEYNGREYEYADHIIFEIPSALYVMYHDHDDSENVWLEEVIGDLDDLIGSPIIKASEDTNSFRSGDKKDVTMPNLDKGNSSSYTWTFYNISTIKGTVTLRWYGGSNGYYSEAVDFVKIERN